jgi:flavodoxin
MKVGIIVHSETGNTYSVVQKLQEMLIKKGQAVKVERLSSIGNDQTDIKKIQLKEIPDISSYDALVFAGPVRGASASPVLVAFMSQIGILKGKKAACMVTEMFPFKWMGGNRAINQMVKICEAKEAILYGTGIVNWSSRNRERMILEVVDKLSSL